MKRSSCETGCTCDRVAVRPPWIALTALLMVVLTAGSGCILRTPTLMRVLNGSGSSGTTLPPRPKLATRIARLSKAHLSDAYIDPTSTGRWMRTMGSSPAPLTTLVRCLADGGDPQHCYGTFTDSEAPAAWGLPAVPAIEPLKDPRTPEAGKELDAERFLANARALGSSLAMLEKLVGAGPLPDATLREGVEEGARRAADYVTARSWHRSVVSPSTSIVMSGGAANGAFSAGVVWRLMEVLESCRADTSNRGCSGAKVDLVVGTSTGALIGLVIDLHSTPGHEVAARDLLVHSYTCSVDSNLYCVNDRWDWSLWRDLQGLARFDGVRKKIEEEVPPEVSTNGTEMVAVSVDFDSGDVYAQSDQDPEDRGTHAQRVDGVLASIVEPVLAEPIHELTRDGQPIKGTFLDGGVRSGLPLLEAVHRGAERVLVLATSRIDPDTIEPPRHALGIIGRTVDLLVDQPRVDEVQLGELSGLERRWLEYNVCSENRLKELANDFGTDVNNFCRHVKFFSTEGPEGASTGWMGPAHFDQVASSWKTAWVFRPEEKVETLGGYSFDPEKMRKLFELGVRTFQNRCEEILDVLWIHGSVAQSSCDESPDAVVKRVQGQYQDLAECRKDQHVIKKCRKRP